jgi:pyruvate dehydrogenase E2 component (dihydrolipoamide acetyltransferase)|tara:strand:+ start:1894 stop:3126 length:1233 start_codon:yes stop_codon:yes gene_type:complete
MATTVHIPKVGMTMEDGDLVRWLVADGATVHPGQIVFEMETEKVEIEVEAEEEGVLKQLVAAGTKLKPGAVVGCLLVGSESEVPSDILSQVAGQWSEVVSFDAPAPVSEPVTKEQKAPAGKTAERVVSSPAARRLAREHDIDISELSGTGPRGRITEQDVRGRIEAGAPVNREAVATPAGQVHPTVNEIPYSGRRRTIGERMHASLRDSAQLTLASEIPADAMIAVMNGLNEEWTGERLALLSPLVMKASALALREHPRLNARIAGDTITLEQEVNIGFATDLEEGLMVPVVRAVDRMPLKDLAVRVGELTVRARDNDLSIDDVSGGTFTVSSLAKLPVDAFTPVLNTPQVAILGVGRLRDVVRLEGSTVVPGKATTLSLTFDHRVVDGAPAGRFLARIGELLTRPYMLM